MTIQGETLFQFCKENSDGVGGCQYRKGTGARRQLIMALLIKPIFSPSETNFDITAKSSKFIARLVVSLGRAQSNARWIELGPRSLQGSAYH